MNKDDFLKKYDELTMAYQDKEAKLEVEVQKWLNGSSSLSDTSMEQLIETVNNQVEELKTLASRVMDEYLRISKEEMELKEGLLSAKTAVKTFLDTSLDEMVITDGVLSSNASESHLVGREKTLEEKEKDKQAALAEIRNKVANKEITLSEASKLKNDVELIYNNQIKR